MKIILQLMLWLFSFSGIAALFIIAALSPCLAAEPCPGINCHISVALGMEVLRYTEYEPDGNIDSDADVSNLMLRGEAVVQWRPFFYGFKGSVPVSRVENIEQWYRSGSLVQTNTLGYGWTRIDGYAGFSLRPFFNPYVGIRWSESDQERTDFILNGSPVVAGSTETVTAWYFFFGATGHIPLNPKWRLIYSGAYFKPFSSKVTNTYLPGWKVTDEDGYAFELEGQVEYAITSTISIAAILYGGQVHWDGSDWKRTSSGSLAKWAENDTEYFGGLLNIRWSF